MFYSTRYLILFYSAISLIYKDLFYKNDYIFIIKSLFFKIRDAELKYNKKFYSEKHILFVSYNKPKQKMNKFLRIYEL